MLATYFDSYAATKQRDIFSLCGIPKWLFTTPVTLFNPPLRLSISTSPGWGQWPSRVSSPTLTMKYGHRSYRKRCLARSDEQHLSTLRGIALLCSLRPGPVNHQKEHGHTVAECLHVLPEVTLVIDVARLITVDLSVDRLPLTLLTMPAAASTPDRTKYTP